MSGWIKLHRQILENEVFRHDKTAWNIFETLLIIADAKTGSWSGGMFQLADLCGVNRNTLYKALLRLELTGMVNRSVNSRYTVYNISNWSIYQGDGKQSGKRQVNSQQTPGNTLTRIKNKELENNTNVLLDKSTYGNSDINDMFEYWEKKLGYEVSSKRQANRNACNNMLKKHGTEKVKRLIDGVALAQQDRYAPRVSDFIQLQSKLSELLVWGKQKGINGVSKGVKL